MPGKNRILNDDTVVSFITANGNPIWLQDIWPRESGTYRIRIGASGFQSGGKPVTFRVDNQSTGLVGYFDAAADKPKAETAGAKKQGADYLFHPDPKTILAQVLPLVVKMALFTAMLESTASEHAARRVAMKNATDSADEMIKNLTREYNRARQGKITQEIAEIVGGANALA